MCTSPYILKPSKNLDTQFVGMEVPCRHCLECRLRRSSQWKLRLSNEFTSWDTGVFVTLTYDNEHLPHNGSLQKEQLIKFTKRLRYYLKERKIKYYACGEYGSKRERPHYHLIIFGLDLNELGKLQSIAKGGYHVDNTDNVLSKAWSYGGKQIGIIHVGNVTSDSISYVASYTSKKTNHTNMDKSIFLKESGREPEFQITSQGMGLSFAVKNVEKIYTDMKLTVGKNKNVPIPPYYWKKLDELQIIDYENDIRPRLQKKAIENSKKILAKYNKICYTNISYEDYENEKKLTFLSTGNHNQDKNLAKKYPLSTTYTYSNLRKIKDTIFKFQQQQNLELRKKFLLNKEFFRDDF